MAQSRTRPLWFGVAACLALVLVVRMRSAANAGQGAELKPSSAVQPVLAAPGSAAVDRFHPDLQPGEDGQRPPQPEPALGGSLTIQQIGKLTKLCSALDNSAGAAAILSVVHDALMVLDPETWEVVPAVARRRVIEDQLVLKPAAAERYPKARALSRLRPASRQEREEVHVLYGALEDAGETWRLVPRSPGNATDAPVEIAKSDVLEVVRGGAVTFELRDDVLWQPSEGFPAHRFDAQDVLFSWRIYSNPHVECDDRRYQFEKVADAEVLGEHAVRFFLGRPDAWAADDLADLCLLPRHLYDLSDPDNPDHRPDASTEEAARYVNENPRNLLWVGLGPWRVTRVDSDGIEAERFAGYFDPARAGYFDRVRWRRFSDDAAAMQAVLAGELDFFDRMSADDYVDGKSELEAFTSHCYKALGQGGRYAYVCWNTQVPALSDARVRRALGHCLNVENDLLRGFYRGMGNVVSGPFPFHSPAYDHSVAPLAFDLEAARKLLAEAGWYDRDGDGWVDRDGAPLTLRFAAIDSSPFSRQVGLLLQENLKEVGVELSVDVLDWPTFQQRTGERQIDAFSQAWLPPLEPDPEQLWHSRWGAPGVRGQNLSGLADAQVDALIEKGQRELDASARFEVWHALHRRLAELAPYLWLVNPATKVAVARDLYGVQLFSVEPGYDLRRWYYAAGTPGTRPAQGVGYWASR